ncbi:MAG: aspartyl/glutamyl-tRNA amidotransferase subunit A [Microbacterium sp. SCN 70-200]|uniref:Asp-tRNA(Asn)/Glu-tRNA(Gln) amidotransferase subunit GatA n=1 Tax=unclassified Microbacterium TaxID=2609290 RepID=UPI000868EAA1|nr:MULTISPECIES: Asp-tRNA(Asn)/Glu-tRNA(Gln) amidotransferase subunit GatA [unclassified Microbacterium]MBN9214539.1 Asp-tRNA(Asn)/Glu-tRNA(Gln) amidotransferase subunit GatA [Microbacterium sp.]ODT41433.1 MAG: aspartyl/glutamyl-tRNA amidotransferase subunit A [Microbacterium sp. SCN 70-200]OJV84087.1 MAG: aspartyl/glutamyl-tRNA amidotransferase subunit A [Microbacterium sp. 70-16]
MSDLIRLTAADLSAKLAAGEVSSVEATQAHLDRIAAVDTEVHAFLHVSDHALEVAADIDRRRAAGEQLGELAGVPLAIKDVLVTTDMPSTSGSKILEGFLSPYDATVVARSRAAGLVPLGKTNMDEFAMGSSTEHSAYGPTHNPWDLDRIPGGSGGGSAAAVAAFEAPIALGSDTGGSIRQPAHVTGTVGVKPTYGGVSRFGAIALASSLDQVGPVSRTVLDSALLHDVIAGHDPHDATSLTDAWPSFAAAAREGATGEVLKGLKVGVIRELPDSGFQAGVSASFRESLALLEAQGAEIVEISAPHFEYGVAAYYLILPAEASSNLAKFDSVRFGLRVDVPGGTVEDVMARSRDIGFGDEVKRRIILGTYALSAGYYDAYYGSAQKVRTLIQRDFDTAFAQVDVIATPSAPTTAFRLGEKLDDPLQMYLNDVTTIPVNLAGVPGISIPSGLAAEDGLPVGIQFIAPLREDARLYRVGAALEALLVDSWGGPLLDRAPQLGGAR